MEIVFTILSKGVAITTMKHAQHRAVKFPSQRKPDVCAHPEAVGMSFGQHFLYGMPESDCWPLSALQKNEAVHRA